MVGGRVRDHFEDMPYVVCDGQRRPLEGDAEGGRGAGDGEGDVACLLALKQQPCQFAFLLGTRKEDSLKSSALTLALQRVNVTADPAQLRTS